MFGTERTGGFNVWLCVFAAWSGWCWLEDGYSLLLYPGVRAQLRIGFRSVEKNGLVAARGSVWVNIRVIFVQRGVVVARGTLLC